MPKTTTIAPVVYTFTQSSSGFHPTAVDVGGFFSHIRITAETSTDWVGSGNSFTFQLFSEPRADATYTNTFVPGGAITIEGTPGAHFAESQANAGMYTFLRLNGIVTVTSGSLTINVYVD